MYWYVVLVIPEKYLSLKVTFIEGTEGRVTFKASHLTGVFEALKDEEFFYRVCVDNGVVTWPAELDIAPDAMYKEIKTNGFWVLE